MTNWFPSVLWHCWFGHLACKNRPRNDLLCVEWDVKSYTLTHSLTHTTECSVVLTWNDMITGVCIWVGWGWGHLWRHGAREHLYHVWWWRWVGGVLYMSIIIPSGLPRPSTATHPQVSTITLHHSLVVLSHDGLQRVNVVGLNSVTCHSAQLLVSGRATQT